MAVLAKYTSSNGWIRFDRNLLRVLIRRRNLSPYKLYPINGN